MERKFMQIFKKGNNRLIVILMMTDLVFQRINIEMYLNLFLDLIKVEA